MYISGYHTHPYMYMYSDGFTSTFYRYVSTFNDTMHILLFYQALFHSYFCFRGEISKAGMHIGLKVGTFGSLVACLEFFDLYGTHVCCSLQVPDKNSVYRLLLHVYVSFFLRVNCKCQIIDYDFSGNTMVYGYTKLMYCNSLFLPCTVSNSA